MTLEPKHNLCSCQSASSTCPSQGSSMIQRHLDIEILRCTNFNTGESSHNLFLHMVNMYLIIFGAWSGSDLRGVPPLIFAETRAPPLSFLQRHFAEKSVCAAWLCWRQGTTTFLRKKCLRHPIENSWIYPCMMVNLERMLVLLSY